MRGLRAFHLAARPRQNGLFLLSPYDALKDGKSKQSAMHTARQMAVGYLNDYWRRTAPKFGYEFITRKKDYTYNR